MEAKRIRIRKIMSGVQYLRTAGGTIVLSSCLLRLFAGFQPQVIARTLCQFHQRLLQVDSQLEFFALSLLGRVFIERFPRDKDHQLLLFPYALCASRDLQRFYLDPHGPESPSCDIGSAPPEWKVGQQLAARCRGHDERIESRCCAYDKRFRQHGNSQTDGPVLPLDFAIVENAAGQHNIGARLHAKGAKLRDIELFVGKIQASAHLARLREWNNMESRL